MAIDSGIFRAYDIRGKVGAGITAETAELLGKAFGTYVASDGEAEIAVGRDNRASGEELKAALMRGLVSTGCTVYDIGMSTSPALYFAVGHWGLPGGVNVTGSHNPPDENGFKLVGESNRPIAGDEILKVRDVIEAGVFRTGEGRIVEREFRPEYFAHQKRATQLGRPMRVVVDTGNGVAGLFAPALLREVGCEVIELHTELDPTYPNHLPDPQMPENVVCVQEKVRETGAELGLAFDGDGDRLGVIDERGERHEADYILMLLSRDLLAEQPGATVIMDVKTSQPVMDDIEEHGGVPLLWKTGHSFIKLKMREARAPLAGEASGHIFYRENFYSDDALFAACKLLTFLSQSDRPITGHLQGMSRWFASTELRVPCADDRKWDVVDAVAGELRERHESIDIDGIRATFPDGWALVRASNTGPNLTLRFEAKSKDGLRAIEDEVLGALRKHIEVPESRTH
ncbi:MAG: phosphomannomutase/phosphoglucomutase [Dehalococcoidia bacterium]|nr:phosphomannomutase/phosphoglucomutase [Dehalococcoidia bacterium]